MMQIQKYPGLPQKSAPLILAPAGNKASFLAALAAGADAVYCGLKSFSARMEAKNFTVEELYPLKQLAQDMGIKVYVALNSILKPGDINRVGKILVKLDRLVKPDALIIQDLSFVELARQTGFSGELHLSTLANVSLPAALKPIREKLGIDRVVIPRELSIDEIKTMASACPHGLSLEVFVHGALCYGVSGRCYWSSYFGGKSGLRGRCVQPCRRLYTQKGQKRRFFSCRDLSLDVLAKVLLSVPEVNTWKIEGRKKGPHYVFYTTQAYRILRDQGTDPKMKKIAIGLLEHALGRTGTHYNFLPQRPQNPINIDGQSGSGLLVGKIQGGKQRPYLNPKTELLPGDLLRIGYEDESWHTIHKVSKYVPKRGRLYLKLSSGKKDAGMAPVFLTNRLEKTLGEMLSELEAKLAVSQKTQPATSTFIAGLPAKDPKKSGGKGKILEMHVHRKPSSLKQGLTGVWLSDEAQKGLQKSVKQKIWWWLPPVTWPEDETKQKNLIELAEKNGCRNFVLNSPWQINLFSNPKKLNLWAGPFCNIANNTAISILSSLGFAGVIVSPELSRKDYLLLPKHSPLPLGIVIEGYWPVSISRILCENFKTETIFSSPKGEDAWVKKQGSDFWIYPNWNLDIKSKKDELQRAGYSLFAYLHEPLPANIKLKKRPGLWNWNLGLL
ncbi:MAG: putative protease [Desulfobacteraceae bacterium Eth-SRB1]|nr:MAG: putative protease [Desulfobacteraceae bacterium Eth-SRB1]